jgi:hypothetical protein
MKVRRVVTGHDSSGKSVFVSDGEVEPVTAELMPGSEFHKLWGGDRTPQFPDDGAAPAQPTYFPPVGGFRFGMFSLPPQSRAVGPQPTDVAAAAPMPSTKIALTRSMRCPHLPLESAPLRRQDAAPVMSHMPAMVMMGACPLTRLHRLCF